MTDVEGPPLGHDPRSTVQLHERVAVIETEVRGIKEGVAVVRSTLHEVNNRMQQFVAAERDSGRLLAQMAETTRELPTISANARDFAVMKAKLQEVIDEQQRRQGSWAAYAVVGSMLMGAAVIGGALATIGTWMHSIHP